MRWSRARTIPAVKEVILALNATVDGQTTAHYITDLLHGANVAVTPARAWRSGRRRARLSRRGHAYRRRSAAARRFRLTVPATDPDRITVLPDRQPGIWPNSCFRECRSGDYPHVLNLRRRAFDRVPDHCGRRDADKLALPRPVIEAGLKKARCTLPANQAEVIGTERLSPRLEIVEVTCWRAAYNAGSILFAVPEQPAGGRPVADGREMAERPASGAAYSVSSPGYDAKTRTLSSSLQGPRRRRLRHDPGIEMDRLAFPPAQRLEQGQCDGEPFEWDSREKWQVFPTTGVSPAGLGARCPRHRFSDANTRRPRADGRSNFRWRKPVEMPAHLQPPQQHQARQRRPARRSRRTTPSRSPSATKPAPDDR